MASIIKTFTVDAPVGTVWDALRDFGNVHVRLAPGFVVECAVDEPGTRTIRFFNGTLVREALIGIDEAARRLAYSVVDGPLSPAHHQASAQVTDAGDGTTTFVWVTDVLPGEVAPQIADLMDRGIEVMRAALATPANSGRSSR